jgi:hypothetical protein
MPEKKPTDWDAVQGIDRPEDKELHAQPARRYNLNPDWADLADEYDKQVAALRTAITKFAAVGWGKVTA